MLGHAEHILDRDIRQHSFVARAKNKAGAKGFKEPVNFSVNVGSLAVLEEILGIYAAHESDATVEARREEFRFHASSANLKRMQTVHAGGDKIVNDVRNATATVKRKVQPMPVCLRGELCNPRQKKFAKMCGRHEQTVLGAKIIADEQGIHEAARRGEKKFVGFVIKIANPFGGGANQIRLRQHEHEQFLGAKEVTEIVEERRPKPAQAVNIAKRAQLAETFREVEMLGFWKINGVKRGDVFGVRKQTQSGKADRIGILPWAHGFALRMPVGGRDILGRDPADVVVDGLLNLLKRTGAERGVDFRHRLRLRLAQPEAGMIHRLATNELLDVFS